jgi:hypothetical protein
MEIRDFGDVMQKTGVLIGLIGLLFGNLTMMYIGSIIVLLRNIYDLFIGKLIPLVSVGIIVGFVYLMKNIVYGVMYGAIIGNLLEVGTHIAINKLRRVYVKQKEEPLNESE